MIRKATIEDLPRMASCAAKFYATSRFLRGFEINNFIALWTELLERQIGVIFLFEDEAGEIRGAIGGMKSADPYSREPYSMEMYWWVEPEHRGAGMRLYRAFEKWSREVGCAEIRMVHLADSMPEKLELLYRRLGFEPLEVHYGKRL